MATATRTVADAMADPASAIARAYAATSAARAERLARARALMERDGITLDEAVARVWATLTLVPPPRR